MKSKILSFCLAFILIIGILPSQAFAIEADNPELQDFLESIEWDLDDYEQYLDDRGWSLDEFWEVDELGTPVTEETLETIYKEYDLNFEELNETLRESGELLPDEDTVMDSFWFLFIEDIEMSLDWMEDGDTAFAFDDEVTDEGLEAIVSDYGLHSVDELEEVFNTYDDSLNNYTSLFDIDDATYYYLSESDDTTSGFSEEDDWGDNWDAEFTDPDFAEVPPAVEIYMIITWMSLQVLTDI